MSNLTAQQIYEKEKYQKVGTFFIDVDCPVCDKPFINGTCKECDELVANLK